MLAFRNLLHDRVRFVVTLVGIVFSVVLSATQLGLFLGFTKATVDVIERSGADLWVMSEGVTHLESASPFPESLRHLALGVDGVADAQAHIVSFGTWTRPDGARESVMVVGTERDAAMGQPWNLVAGSIDDLDRADAVLIDELYKEKLRVTHVGQVIEIRDRRARIVGFTRGIRTFTTAPAVFTSLANAHAYAGVPNGRTLYLLIKATPGADLATLAAALRRRLPDVDVWTTAEWSATQRNYWMFGTGAGVSVLVAAVLGLLVGVVVVAQTIYAATVDHIREYGTLKAMGATNRYIYRVIIQQSALSGAIGYVMAIAVAAVVSNASQAGATAILLPWPLAAALFVLTLAMCVSASIVSINKVTRLDPAMVFKN
jgi:putative ABC transport system permease protein